MTIKLNSQRKDQTKEKKRKTSARFG